MKTLFLTAVIYTVLLYIGYTLINTSFVPFEWTENSRISFVGIWLSGIGILLIALLVNIENGKIDVRLKDKS